jgi:hypothetical protein
MSYFRSYFEKNNTILKDLHVNTSKNPTTEIFYGSGFSKFIFKIDLTDLQNKVDNGDLILSEGTTHTLHLTNCIFGNETFKGANRGTGRERATSFDLILFEIEESWDEGIGFDYSDNDNEMSTGNKSFVQRPSNWFYKTTTDEWETPGIYTTGVTILDTIHFDNGNENINVDITSYINDVLQGEVTNNGLGLAFSIPYETLSTDIDKSVSFFTKYTQTFFEPYVESFFNDRILDNRYSFVEKTNQNLYLYVSKDGNYHNLDELPLVDILDSSNNPINGLTGLTSELVRKGVYKVTFGIGGTLCDGRRFFYDNWRNLIIDGESIGDTKQKFIPKKLTSSITLGENNTSFERFKVQYYGIQQNEKIIRGDIRKIVTNFRSIENPLNTVINESYYRVFIKEGNTNVIVHDWTLMDVANENFFMLDTINYIPREYFIEIKGKYNNEEIHYNEYIKFEILSEK